MKKSFIFFFLIPFFGYAQIKPYTNKEVKIISNNQKEIENLVNKYKQKLKNTGGYEGWRLQIKFTSKREDIVPYQIKFASLYPEIPAQITFDSPYYKLSAGNYRTRNEALKTKNIIRKNFPGSHPISIIIDPSLFKK